MKIRIFMLLAVLCCMTAGNELLAQMEQQETEKLVVLWVSGDPDVAEKSCLMYTHAAMKYRWFEEVTLVIWGPSAKLVAENEKIREKVLAMKADGVVLEACIACSNMLEVTDELKELGIDVKGMGLPLSDYLKSGAHVLTY